MSFLNPTSPQVASGVRGKVALKPGHSLMDWVRFKARVVPKRPLTVTKEELSKHNTVDDAWTAINGAVYDITSYIEYHPGGAEELLKGAGIDSTDLFNDVHKWVNFQNMLKEFLVGYLVADTFQKPRATLEIPLVKQLPAGTLIPAVLFKYDHYQSERCYTLIVYSKISPASKVRNCYHYGCVKDGIVRFWINCLDKQFTLHIKLNSKILNWEVRNCNLKFEIVFHKKDSRLWENEGTHLEGSKNIVNKGYGLLPFRAACHANEIKTHNTRLLTFCVEDDYHFSPCLGSHVYVLHPDRDTMMQSKKPYTVFNVIDGKTFQLLIKEYKDGIFSSYMCGMQINQKTDFEGFDHCLNLNSLLCSRSIVILAAGTGITPFYRIVAEMSGNRVFEEITCNILFYNKTQKDILVQKEFKQLQNGNFNLKISNVLSDEHWDGLEGRVCSEHLVKFPKDSIFMICGPVAFNRNAIELLMSMNVNKLNIIEFSG